MRDAAKNVLLGLVMAAIAAVVAARAIEQWNRPGALTARGETRWLGWAYRDPGLLARLESAQELLRPGERFCVESNLSRVDPGWLLAMTNYAFWREPPAGTCPDRARTTASLTRVVIADDGAVTIFRTAHR
jgi:hypothetical protein